MRSVIEVFRPVGTAGESRVGRSMPGRGPARTGRKRLFPVAIINTAIRIIFITRLTAVDTFPSVAVAETVFGDHSAGELFMAAVQACIDNGDRDSFAGIARIMDRTDRGQLFYLAFQIR